MSMHDRIQCPVCGHRVIRLNPQKQLRLFQVDIGGRGHVEWIELEPELEDITEIESVVKSVSMRLTQQRKRLENEE